MAELGYKNYIFIDGDIPGEGEQTGCRVRMPVPFNLTSLETAYGLEKGKELGDKLQHSLADEQKNKHDRNENQYQQIQDEDLQEMLLASGLFIGIDIRYFLFHILYRAEGKPQGKDDTKSQDGAVGEFCHVDDSHI